MLQETGPSQACSQQELRGTESPLRCTATAADSRIPLLKRSREGGKSAFKFSKCSERRRERGGGSSILPSSGSSPVEGERDPSTGSTMPNVELRGAANFTRYGQTKVHSPLFLLPVIATWGLTPSKG